MVLAAFPDDWTRALCVVAHPDDLEYGVAGAIASWTAAGKHVTYVLVTRGEAGIDAMAPAEAARVRQAHDRATPPAQRGGGPPPTGPPPAPAAWRCSTPHGMPAPGGSSPVPGRPPPANPGPACGWSRSAAPRSRRTTSTSARTSSSGSRACASTP